MQANAIAIITAPSPPPAAGPAAKKNNFFTRMIEKIKKDKKPKLRPLSLVIEVTAKEATKKPSFWKRVKEVGNVSLLSRTTMADRLCLCYIQNFNKTFAKKKSSSKSPPSPSANIAEKEALTQSQKLAAPLADAKSVPQDEECALTSKTSCQSINPDEALRQFQISSALFADASYDDEEEIDEDDYFYSKFDHSVIRKDVDFTAVKSCPVVEMASIAIPEAQCAVVEYWPEAAPEACSAAVEFWPETVSEACSVSVGYWEELIPEACSAVVEFWPTIEETTEEITASSDIAVPMTPTALEPEPDVVVTDIVIEEYAHTEVLTNPAEIDLGLFIVKDLDYLLPDVLRGSKPEPAPATVAVNLSRASGSKFVLATPPSPLRRKCVNVAKVNSEGIKRPSRPSRTSRVSGRGKENARPVGLLSAISE